MDLSRQTSCLSGRICHLPGQPTKFARQIGHLSRRIHGAYGYKRFNEGKVAADKLQRREDGSESWVEVGRQPWNGILPSRDSRAEKD